MDRQAHWQRLYGASETEAASWFQPAPTVSAQLLEAAGLRPDT